MNRTGRGMVMFFLGIMLGRLLLSGGFGWFVQQRMQIPLILAAIVLTFFGLYEVYGAWKEGKDNPELVSQAVGPKVGWLLVLPLLVLVSIAPTGLGAAAADRVDAYSPTETEEEFAALDAGSGPVELRVYDFINRALWDDAKSLDGVPVRLEGLVVNDPDIPDGFKLTRFMVSCCAADGIPLQVNVRGVDQAYEDDTWVTADVMWREPETTEGETGDQLVTADAIVVSEVPGGAGNDPYESPYD